MNLQAIKQYYNLEKILDLRESELGSHVGSLKGDLSQCCQAKALLLKVSTPCNDVVTSFLDKLGFTPVALIDKSAFQKDILFLNVGHPMIPAETRGSGFSIIVLCDDLPGDPRFTLFDKTLAKYHELHPNLYQRFPGTEFILGTRTNSYRLSHRIDQVIRYECGCNFSPTFGYNLGIQQAKNDNIIITCPEVLPITPVLEQFSTERGNNIQSQWFTENGEVSFSSTVHNEHPGSPTLALFNRKDILAVNGWDEAFVVGYAWEDTDFGTRFNRAGIPFRFRDDIQAVHMDHARTNKNWPGYCINQQLFESNNLNGIIKPKNGIVKL